MKKLERKPHTRSARYNHLFGESHFSIPNSSTSQTRLRHLFLVPLPFRKRLWPSAEIMPSQAACHPSLEQQGLVVLPVAEPASRLCRFSSLVSLQTGLHLAQPAPYPLDSLISSLFHPYQNRR